MAWFVITIIFSTLLELVGLGRLKERDKDPEILILRYQLDILERKQTQPIQLTKAEKLTLAVLINKLGMVKRCSSGQLQT